ncbi:MAG: M16 family metallopeptidase, partial [Terriglobia bacterium]
MPQTHLAAWPYTNFGAAGAVVDKSRLDDLDTTLVRFANGVRLTVKSTKYRAQQILIAVTLAGGRRSLPKDRSLLNTSAYIGGGLEAMDSFDLRRVLSSKIYNVGFGIDDDSFSLSGSTRPEDLDTQLQVLAAYVTAPGWRTEAFAQGIAAMTNNLAQRDTSPMALFGAKLPSLLRNGDARWTAPESADLQKARLEDVRSAIDPALKHAPIEIAIVGDIDENKVIAEVAKTFGALPERKPASTWFRSTQPVVFRKDRTPIVLTHNGEANQAIASIYWPVDIDPEANPDKAEALGVLGAIMRLKVTDEIRENLGATYSPSAGASLS